MWVKLCLLSSGSQTLQQSSNTFGCYFLLDDGKLVRGTTSKAVAIFLRTNSTAKRAFRSRHLNVSWNALSRWCVRHKKKRHLANVLFDVLFQRTVGYDICVILQVNPSVTWLRTKYLDHKTSIYFVRKEWRLPSTNQPSDKTNTQECKIWGSHSYGYKDDFFLDD